MSKNWSQLLKEVRTFFEQERAASHPNARAGREGKGGKGERNSRHALAFSQPQFFVFRFAKCAAVCKLTYFVRKIIKVVKPVSFVIFQNFRYPSSRFKQ